MGKTCVIMQPTYLPWAGYFNLILNSDIFVFLDDVQFEKQSWQNRNKILINSKENWLTVPVNRKGLNSYINEINVEDTQKWRKKHVTSISQGYSRHPYFQHLEKVLNIIQDKSLIKLIDINVNIIITLCNLLKIKKEFVRSSDLGCNGTRSEKLLKIIKKLGCSNYLSPQGSKDYIQKDGVLENSNIDVSYQDYKIKSYNQRKSESFISHLSIIDVITNLDLAETNIYINN